MKLKLWILLLARTAVFCGCGMEGGRECRRSRLSCAFVMYSQKMSKFPTTVRIQPTSLSKADNCRMGLGKRRTLTHGEFLLFLFRCCLCWCCWSLHYLFWRIGFRLGSRMLLVVLVLRVGCERNRNLDRGIGLRRCPERLPR